MSIENKPDMSCVPYSRKGVYFALTIPFLVIVILVFVYLWRNNILLSFVLLALYLATSYFQAYCCAYQECPYIGRFCPAIVGIYPANLFAKLLYGRKKVVESKVRFEVQATLATIGWLGIAILPLYWLWQLGAIFAIGYFASHVIYYLIYGLTVCPKCAIRDTCPGGKLQSVVLKR
jgi:hypothetical protein